MHRTLLILSVVAASICPVENGFCSEPDTSQRSVRFNRDIRAILTDKCFACHGPDAKTVEGGLRLDLPESATDESTGAIVPGKPDESELIRRIESEDSFEIMPPPESHKPLTLAEKKRLRQWIAEGAQYEPHWAYTPMRQTELATDGNATKTIDALIDSRLQSEGIQAAPPADRVTLIRRLYFDLTGIPPTAEEVEQFVSDDAPDAYARLVDALLDSPRYGERMAIYWLDLVRYADTVGYHGDQNVSQSPYRDYVINAFNDNLPYDRFVREQLAGDLLPDATLQQQVASGYNRLNQTTEEGGSQAKEYLAIYFADRVRNVSQVFMGATMGCAQCHDHKYDPYTMRDFYSLGAFFADLDERGVYSARSRPPVLRVPSADQKRRVQLLSEQIVAAESRIDPLRQELLAGQSEWEISTLKAMETPVEVESAWVDDDLLVGGNRSGDWKFVSGKKHPIHSGTKARRQQSDGLTQHFFEKAKTLFQVTEDARFYAWVHLDPKNPPKAIMLQFNDGNWNHRKVWGSDDIPYGKQPESHAAYRRAGELPELGKWVRLEVDANEVGLAAGAKVGGIAFTQFGGVAYWDAAGALQVGNLPPAVVEALQIPVEDRTEAQAETISNHYLENTEALKALRAEIAALKSQRQAISDSAVQTVVSKSVKPRPIRILPRGNWMDDSGDLVEPAIPQFLGKLDTGQRLNRLDLANWLCQDDNPLTARTFVNRVWGLMFGRGICASVDDFGGQGTYPSYPDLLDSLAIDFIESGWDVKHLVRTIVLSEAYQRESTMTDSLRRRDPYNDLFARQGRFCVSAEMVRDSALAISGLLVEEIGGPSVRPYQPAGYYAQLNFPRRKYVADQGESQYRRGLYTHWQRTFLHPMLKAFDAPSREECTAARARSNTPLQALVLLNDPTFVEAARVYAARVMRSPGDVNEKIGWAYRNAVSRIPDESIVTELRKVYEQHLKDYSADESAAKELISIGEAAIETDLNAAELAAWTSVARVILNLHETITRY